MFFFQRSRPVYLFFSLFYSYVDICVCVYCKFKVLTIICLTHDISETNNALFAQTQLRNNFKFFSTT